LCLSRLPEYPHRHLCVAEISQAKKWNTFDIPVRLSHYRMTKKHVKELGKERLIVKIWKLPTQVGQHVLEQTCIPFATANLQRTAYEIGVTNNAFGFRSVRLFSCIRNSYHLNYKSQHKHQ
jgi:hypothetical protein